MLKQPFAPPAPGSAALRGLGSSVRAAQAMGIEWFDYAKQSQDDARGAIERLSGAATPSEAMAVQLAFLRTASERFTASSAVFGGLFVALLAELAESARPRAA